MCLLKRVESTKKRGQQEVTDQNRGLETRTTISLRCIGYPRLCKLAIGSSFRIRYFILQKKKKEYERDIPVIDADERITNRS